MIATASDFTKIETHGDLMIARQKYGRKRFVLIRLNNFGEMLLVLAVRATELQIRAKANEVWLADRGC